MFVKCVAIATYQMTWSWMLTSSSVRYKQKTKMSSLLNKHPSPNLGRNVILLASFPGFPAPEREDVYPGEHGVFSHVAMLIKIGPEFFEQESNGLLVVQSTMHSILGVYDICSPTVTCNYIDTIYISNYPMSYDMSHDCATFSSCASGVMWRTFLRSSRIRSMTMMSSSSRSSHSCEGGV